MPETILDDSETVELRYSPVCDLCARLTDPTARRCEAFDKIPSKIWNAEHNHRSPVKGDGGKLFRPRPNK